MARATSSPSVPAAREHLLAAGYQGDWPFAASTVPRWRQRQVLEALVRRGIRAPRSAELKPVSKKGSWALYFVYLPQGVLTGAHRFTLGRLRDEGFAICVVAAAPEPGKVPTELERWSDALYWKDLPGYDFSAYTLGLRALARRSAGSTVLVLNDSVLGPAHALRPLVEAAPWALTGFSATGLIENHLQSYAFVLRELHPRTLAGLRKVLFPWIACGGRDDVIHCQETRLARIASASMPVGAYWYLQGGDPTQVAPFELVTVGFPFLKRSLMEARSTFPDKERARQFAATLVDGKALPASCTMEQGEVDGTAGTPGFITTQDQPIHVDSEEVR